jgi:hypothetical protein
MLIMMKFYEKRDPNAKSTMWAISPTGAVSVGKIIGGQDVHFKLINFETGVSKSLLFAGTGHSFGTPIEFSNNIF